MKNFIKSTILILMVISNTHAFAESNGKLSNPYINQKLPGMTPVIFAPGIVSTGMWERDLAISPDGKKIYFSLFYRHKHKFISSIILVKNIKGIWKKPEIAPFSGKFSDIEPYIQPDGKKMFFVSRKPIIVGKKNKYRDNMWFMNKTKSGWSKPRPVGEPINGSGSVFYPSITKTSTMYFTRRTKEGEYIYKSKFKNGKFSEPEKLPKNINSTKEQFNTFIAPDEKFIIVPTVIKDNTFGGSDYYVSFNNGNKWSKLINLGIKINTSNWEYSPSLSPDSKYFFFQRDAYIDKKDRKTLKYSDIKNFHNGGGDIYWVDAKVIRDLNPYKNNN